MPHQWEHYIIKRSNDYINGIGWRHHRDRCRELKTLCEALIEEDSMFLVYLIFYHELSKFNPENFPPSLKLALYLNEEIPGVLNNLKKNPRQSCITNFQIFTSKKIQITFGDYYKTLIQILSQTDNQFPLQSYVTSGHFMKEELALGELFLIGGILFDDCQFGIPYFALHMFINLINRVQHKSHHDFEMLKSLCPSQRKLHNKLEGADDIGEFMQDFSTAVYRSSRNMSNINYFNTFTFTNQMKQSLYRFSFQNSLCKDLILTWPEKSLQINEELFMMNSLMFVLSIEHLGSSIRKYVFD